MTGPLFRDTQRRDARDRALAALADIDRLRYLWLHDWDPRIIAAYTELSEALDELYGPLPAETIQERTRH
jgi:hypothetical protein